MKGRKSYGPGGRDAQRGRPIWETLISANCGKNRAVGELEQPRLTPSRLRLVEYSGELQGALGRELRIVDYEQVLVV